MPSLPNLLMESATKAILLMTTLCCFLQSSLHSYRSSQSCNFVILGLSPGCYSMGNKGFISCITGHQSLKNPGVWQSMGLSMQSSLSWYVFNPVLKMQVSKLVIKDSFIICKSRTIKNFPFAPPSRL